MPNKTHSQSWTCLDYSSRNHVTDAELRLSDNQINNGNFRFKHNNSTFLHFPPGPFTSSQKVLKENIKVQVEERIQALDRRLNEFDDFIDIKFPYMKCVLLKMNEY